VAASSLTESSLTEFPLCDRWHHSGGRYGSRPASALKKPKRITACYPVRAEWCSPHLFPGVTLACQAFVIPPSASRVQAGSLAGRPRISYYRPLPGESGSGKELVARALHQLSPRRERRFCDVNCAAADDLLESELFGHLKGAFTGAVADRAGLIDEANVGTLFLDEVTDLSRRAQAKLSPRRRLTHSVLAALARYHWPGNVRELQNVLAGVAVSAPSRGAVKPSAADHHRCAGAIHNTTGSCARSIRAAIY
jgi:Sigma-54 interaction domain